MRSFPAARALLLGCGLGLLALNLSLLPSFWRHRATIEWESGILRALFALAALALAAGALVGLLLALALRRSLPRWLWRGALTLGLASFASLLLVLAWPKSEFLRWSELESAVASDRPNLVLLIADSLRRDVFDDPDSSAAWFPTLSALRAQSLDYEQLHAASSWTPPSMAAMLTGRAPSRLGAHHGVLPDSASTFVEWLRAAGYETVGISDNHLTHPRFGYAQGFTCYWQRNNCIPFAESWLAHWRLAWPYERLVTWAKLQYRGADRTLDALAYWAERRERDRPFALVLHLMDTHYPYYVYSDRPGNLSQRSRPGTFVHYSDVQLSERDLPRAPFARGFLDPEQHADLWYRYLGAAQVVDAATAEVWQWLQREGLDDRTLIVLTADHGEEFHEHGSLAHGRALYQESIRVPLFLRPPTGVAAPAKITAAYSQRALPNTLLAYAGLPLLTAAPDPLPTAPSQLSAAVFAELDRSGTRILAGRFGDVKLLHSVARNGRTRDELYRLGQDPRESQDLAPEFAALPAPMLTRFTLEWERLLGRLDAEQASDEREELLQGLGYMR